MKNLLLILYVVIVAVFACFALIADQLYGVVAYTYRYLLFCILVSLVSVAQWYGVYGKRAALVGFVVFSLFAGQFFLPSPSERILRSAMIKIPPGTDAGEIETIVLQAYEGSAYAPPSISREQSKVHMEPDQPARELESVHVSLSSQDPGNCTAIAFLVEDGVVVHRFFAPD